ncbi:O-antigen ligase family protein [Aquimarina sp. SS2-1]|uniref:O-antigen ligase family protein n=1 Tax=Aquimarina besae TaxID=3342247 RepID=UPI00366AF417
MKHKFINHYSDIQFLLLMVLAAFPILPKGVQSTLIIIMSVLSIIYFFIDGKKYWSIKKTKVLMVLGSLLFISSLSLFYSNDVRLGFKYILRLSPVILIVLVLLIKKTAVLKIDQLYKILLVYVISLFVLLLFLYFNFYAQINDNDISPWELRSHIEEWTNVHGTYLSMWIGMGILILIWLFQKFFIKIWMKMIGVLFFICFYYWLYIIGARMPFFATVVSSILLFSFSLKVPLKFISIGFLIAGISGFILFGYQIYSKVEELSNYENAIPPGKYENTNPLISNENIRSVIYYCSLKNIVEKPFFGYGVGSVNQKMQECYDREFSQTDLFKRFQFNSHSQYLQVILSSGLIGFLLYVISLVILTKWSFRCIKLHFGFLILILLCFTFENILYRHDGIIFFSFFNTILFFARNKEN